MASHNPLCRLWRLLIKKSLMVQWLLDQGASVTQTDHYGDTALLKAVAVGDLNSTSLLIMAGSNVNHRNRDKTTPLHMAALGNRKEIADLLLKNNADYQSYSQSGTRPFQLTNDPELRQRLKNPQKSFGQNNVVPEPATVGTSPDDQNLMTSLASAIAKYRKKSPGPDGPTIGN